MKLLVIAILALMSSLSDAKNVANFKDWPKVDAQGNVTQAGSSQQSGGVIASKGTMNMTGNKMVLMPSMYYSLSIKNDTKATYFVELATSRSRLLITPGKTRGMTARKFDLPLSLKSLNLSFNDFVIEEIQAANLTSMDKSSMVTKKECSEDEQEVYFRVTKAFSAPDNMGTNKIAQVFKLCKPKEATKAITLNVMIQSESVDLKI